MFFWGGGKCPNLGVVNVRILGVVNVLLANDSQSPIIGPSYAAKLLHRDHSQCKAQMHTMTSSERDNFCNFKSLTKPIQDEKNQLLTTNIWLNLVSISKKQLKYSLEH